MENPPKNTRRKHDINSVSTEETVESETEGAASPRPETEPPRWLVLTLQTLAYAIPLTFLAYVLYINYLPFGYDKTFTIDVGSESDTDNSQPFYLQPSADLGSRISDADGTTYRELDGIVFAVFNPDVVLKDAEITVSVEGEGVSIIPPVINFDPDSIDWDYEWDFTQGKTPEELGLIGDTFTYEGAMYFDGLSQLELPDTHDLFESGPFTVYIEWTPEDIENDLQQIIGHYNWEVFQNKDSVSFNVGRMNDEEGPILSLKQAIDKDFLNKKHKAIISYLPLNNSGIISLSIDDLPTITKSIGANRIWSDYWDKPLSFGKSYHGDTTHFIGSIQRIKIINGTVLVTQSRYTTTNKDSLKVTFYAKNKSIFLGTEIKLLKN